MKNVHQLTDNNFGQTVEADSKAWFVMFYAPWCGHCKRLKPIWANLSEHEGLAAGRGMNLGMLDCTTWKSTCDKHGVEGYPGLRYWLDGRMYDYKGVRALGAFTSFIKRVVDPATPKLKSKEEVKTYLESSPEVAVLFIQGDDEKAATEFDDVLSDVQLQTASFSSLRFAEVYSNSVLQEYKSSSSSSSLATVIVNDVSSYTYKGNEITPSSLSNWIEDNRFLEVEELDQSKFWAIGHKGKLMCILLYDKEKEVAGQEAVGVKPLREVAKQDKYRESFVFGRLDGVYWAPWVKQFNIQRDQYPYLFVYDAVSEVYYSNEGLAAKIADSLTKGSGDAADHIGTFLTRVKNGDEPSRVSGFAGYLMIVKKMVFQSLDWFAAQGLPVQFGVLFVPTVLVAFVIKACCCGRPAVKRD
eukprot:TRINITY_DN84316_c0_g1_i1.p1 TRINITY_DN84316_c0_g1~~TRINITY_DN84316_c0_g1_i1.p1  ORF type:complete len:454 (-),score=21.94 TRINITY_DN84316_c0_g1_i1:149-1387(-)